MKRFLVVAGLGLAFVLPGVALAHSPSPRHVRVYLREYRRVARKLGRRAPGRNIVRDGLATNRAASDSDVMGSLAVLRRMLAPAPPVVSQPVVATTEVAPSSAAPVTSTVSSPAAASSSGAGGVPACASESGTNYSTGPANTNASSGATGRYQITPGTSAAYGCDLSTAAGQDACAQVIYQNQGAGAWVGCGG